MWNRSIFPNTTIVKHMSHAFKAFVPASYSKTHSDYMWLLPDVHDRVTQSILTNDVTGFETDDCLYRSLQNFYKRQLLEKVEGILIRHSRTNYYCMRTARAFRATEWVRLVTEYRYMKWKPEPLNPLQHKKMDMTLDRYSVKDENQEWKVQMRCVEKYATVPHLYQDWMAPYVSKLLVSRPPTAQRR